MDQLEYDDAMSELAANKADQESARADIARQRIEKTEISELVDTQEERVAASKRRFSDAITDRGIKRRRQSELQEQLKTANMAFATADELYDTAWRAYFNERDALETYQQALKRIALNENRLNSEIKRLMDETIQEEQAAEATLSYMEPAFETWKSELYLKSGALIHPIPYDNVDKSFQNRDLSISGVKDFLHCITDPEFWVNRLSVVAKQAAEAPQLCGYMSEDALKMLGKTESGRLLRAAKEAEVLCALYCGFSEQVKAEKERLGRLAPPPRGNHTLLAKGNMSQQFAKEYNYTRYLTLPHNSESENGAAAHVLKDVEAGEHLSRLNSQLSPSAAYVLPLAEVLKVVNTKHCRYVPNYAYEWLLDFFAKPETKKLREFVNSLCAVVDRYHGFTKSLDLSAFTKKLNDFRTARGLSIPPPHQREDHVAHGDFALRGYDMQDDAEVTLNGFKGYKLTVDWPTEILEAIVGFDTDGDAIHANSHAVGLAMHLLSDANRAADRELAVLPDYVPDNPTDGSTIICLVRVDGKNGYWLATKLKMAAASEGAAVQVTEIIIYSPLGGRVGPDRVARLSAHAIVQIGRFYKLADARRSYTWPVARTKSKADSGIHAICHGLSLMNCGVPWLGSMAFNDILEMRQLLLRVVIRALVENSKIQTAQ